MFSFLGMGGLNGDPDIPDEDRDYEPYYRKNYYSKTNNKPKYTTPEEYFGDEYNKWHYHKKVNVEVVHETELAYLVKDKIGKYWIPKKLIHFGKRKIRQLKKFEVKYIELNNEA